LTDIERMAISEFVDEGYLQEVNRRFFHPLGLALEDGSVLSWRGENYVPQKATLRVRIHNWWVGRQNRRYAD
jgi:hypothetical protein